jgi:hypothetical protein
VSLRCAQELWDLVTVLVKPAKARLKHAEQLKRGLPEPADELAQ